MRGKGPPNWIEYDKAGRVVERRWYATGGMIAADQPVPDVAGKCANEERGHAAHRRVSRGAVDQDRLL